MLGNLSSKVSGLLPQGGVAKSIGVLAGGSAGSQLILVLVSPVLTRIYSPDDYGLLAVYVGMLGLFTVISSLRYELAIPLPEKNRDAIHVAMLSLLVVVCVAFVSAIIVAFFSGPLALLLGVPEIETYLWLLPVGVLFMGTYQVLSYWAIRCKRFGLVAKTRLSQVIVTVSIQLAGYKAGVAGLLAGQVSGQTVGNISLGKLLKSDPEIKTLSWRGIRNVAERYKRFPLFSTWSGFFNTAGQQMPPLMFAGYFGASAVGFYALANRIIAMPMGVIGQAVSNVFLSHAAEIHREGRLGKVVEVAHRELINFILPAVIVLILFGPDLFSVVFGSSWKVSGEIGSWLALWLLVSFSTSPISTTFSVIEKQFLNMVMQGCLLGCRLLGIYIGVQMGDFMTAVKCFAVANVFGYVLFLSVLFVLVNASIGRLFSNYLLPALLVISCFFVSPFLADMDGPYRLVAFFLVSVSSLLFYLRLYKRHMSSDGNQSAIWNQS